AGFEVCGFSSRFLSLKRALPAGLGLLSLRDADAALLGRDRFSPECAVSRDSDFGACALPAEGENFGSTVSSTGSGVLSDFPSVREIRNAWPATRVLFRPWKISGGMLSGKSTRLWSSKICMRPM